MTTKVKNIVSVCLLAILLFGLSIYCWAKPADEFSDSERRKLDQFPKITWDSILSGKFMTDFEDYTLDQFPLRDRFRMLKSFSRFYLFAQKDNNDIFIEDGYASKLEYPMSESSMDYAAERFQHLYDKYMADTDCNVYFSIIPDKSYFLAEQNGYLSLDYETFFEMMKEKTDFMEYIDIAGLLAITDYYKTDTHWRQEKIVDVAAKLAEAMGVTLSGNYTEKTLDNPFYGVYYGQSALPLSPETIYYLTSDVLEDCKVYNYETGKPVEMSIYDMEKAYGKDPYEMFLSGSLSLITIENPNATTDKELVIFRDSFGSSITPLLVEGYAKITLVDIRYISSDIVGNFVNFDNQDVLFLYSTLILNNSVTLK